MGGRGMGEAPDGDADDLRHARTRLLQSQPLHDIAESCMPVSFGLPEARRPLLSNTEAERVSPTYARGLPSVHAHGSRDSSSHRSPIKRSARDWGTDGAPTLPKLMDDSESSAGASGGESDDEDAMSGHERDNVATLAAREAERAAHQSRKQCAQQMHAEDIKKVV